MLDHAALLAAAREILPESWRSACGIHRLPEIGLDLPATQALVLEEFGLGLVPSSGGAVSSVMATIEGADPDRPSCCAPTWTRCR